MFKGIKYNVPKSFQNNAMKTDIFIVLAPAQEMELGFERHELMATPHGPSNLQVFLAGYG